MTENKPERGVMYHVMVQRATDLTPGKESEPAYLTMVASHCSVPLLYGVLEGRGPTAEISFADWKERTFNWLRSRPDYNDWPVPYDATYKLQTPETQIWCWWPQSECLTHLATSTAQ